jgi:hypothetical protein
MPVIRTLRVSILSLTLIGVAAACGSSTKSTTAAAPATTAAATATTAAPAATTAGAATTAAASAATTAAAPATTAAPAATTAKPADSTAAPAAAAPAGPACTGLGAAGAGATTADVSLIEWDIKGPATVKAGKVTFNIKNTGSNKHEMALIKGDSFDALPKAANGAVDETKLEADALLGRTEKLDGNKSCSATVDLAPGKYVMVCNIAFGAISHAAKGQKFNFEVTA